MLIELVTPDKKVYQKEFYEAILPTPQGQISILPQHEALITLLSPGVISLRNKKDDPDFLLEHLATAGGVAEITANKIRILAESADRAEDLNEFEIKQAKARALEARRQAKDDISSTDASIELERSLAQLKVLELKKRRHQTKG